MKMSKGTVEISTASNIHIRKAAPFNSFTIENVVADLNEAAEKSNFQNFNDEPITFEFIKLLDESSYGNKIKEMVFKMNNFKNVSFTMSTSLDEKERIYFRAWSKFWIELTKLGYRIK